MLAISLADRILHAIRAHSVSFVQVEQACPEMLGSIVWGDHDNNIVYWWRASPECCMALSQLLSKNLVKLRPCSPMIYVEQGTAPKLPITFEDDVVHSEPHWLPVVLRLTDKGKAYVAKLEPTSPN